MNINKNSEQEINDFLNKVEIPLGKSKEEIWAEKFENVVLSDSFPSTPQKKKRFFHCHHSNTGFSLGRWY